MSRRVLFAVAVLVNTSCALGDWIVSRGETMQIWFYQGQGPQIQFSIVYEEPGGVDPNTLIGDDLWFDQPGIYDLSGDPQFFEFLSYATNGKSDPGELQVFDQASLRLDGFMTEELWLGRFPDLAPLAVTRGQMHVLDIALQSEGVRLTIQMEYLGVPEPASILLVAVMGGVGFGWQRSVTYFEY